MRATNDVTAPSRDQVNQRAPSTTMQPVTSTRGPDRTIRDRSPSHRSQLSLFLSVVLRPGRMPPLTTQSDFVPFIRGPDCYGSKYLTGGLTHLTSSQSDGRGVKWA